MAIICDHYLLATIFAFLVAALVELVTGEVGSPAARVVVVVILDAPVVLALPSGAILVSAVAVRVTLVKAARAA